MAPTPCKYKARVSPEPEWFLHESLLNLIYQEITVRQLLASKSSSSALYNSGHSFDQLKCHPNTRVAVLKKLMDWITSQDKETKNKMILWLKGPAGSGKSVIARTLSEQCDTEGRLLASFFFRRDDDSRNGSEKFIATIAYQVHRSHPTIQQSIASVIDNDPMIFMQALAIQLETLIVNPLRSLIDLGYVQSPTSRRLIVIDGLDECVDRRQQQDILNTIFQCITRLSCPILYLIASRPERQITYFFGSKANQRLHSEIVLDANYHPDKDIQTYLVDKFKHIQETHSQRSALRNWPKPSVITELVEKASGQFIYASTVVKYVESLYHRPDHRLDIVRNLRPRTSDADMPFAELDTLYTHILSTIEDIDKVLHIFAVQISDVPFKIANTDIGIDEICDFENGTVKLLLGNLASLVELQPVNLGADDGECDVQFMHASLIDFLLDATRSKTFYIDRKWALGKVVEDCFRYISREPFLTLFACYA